MDWLPELPFPLAMLALAATAWLVWRWPYPSRDRQSVEAYARQCQALRSPRSLPGNRR